MANRNQARIEYYDYILKLLVIGDSGVGKTLFCQGFTSGRSEDQVFSTIGVDFFFKYMTLAGKRLKLVIWDTAGQERFRTLTAAYYRGAQGVILMHDITRRETFTNLSDVWNKELDLHLVNQDCVKMLVGNKVDKESERLVFEKEGTEFAREWGCMFLECSARTQYNVEQCFEEVVLKILKTPSLVPEVAEVPVTTVPLEKKATDAPKRKWCYYF